MVTNKTGISRLFSQKEGVLKKKKTTDVGFLPKKPVVVFLGHIVLDKN